jgi:hypothetical protein
VAGDRISDRQLGVPASLGQIDRYLLPPLRPPVFQCLLRCGHLDLRPCAQRADHHRWTCHCRCKSFLSVPSQPPFNPLKAEIT